MKDPSAPTPSRSNLQWQRLSDHGARVKKISVPGKGYRFIAPVEALSGPGAQGPTRSARPPSKRLAAGMAALVLVAGFVTWAWFGAGATVSPVTVAVLPFEILGGDPEREYLADGLAEDTIAALGQVDPEHIGVIGRTSLMVYKRTTKSLTPTRMTSI